MRLALCQLPVSSQPAVNLSRVQAALREAADQGADLAVFPEATQLRFGSDLAQLLLYGGHRARSVLPSRLATQASSSESCINATFKIMSR